MSRFTASRAEWLGLGAASRLLGVAPGTLRRWSDSGRVTAFTTPGGHRRYRRAALERMLPRDRAARPRLAPSGMTAARLRSAYQREARSAVHRMPWLGELTDRQRDWFRTHGRELAERLVAYLDAPTDDAASDSLQHAADEASKYGRMAADMGVSLSQTVEGFLQFRRPFLHQLAQFANRRSLDAATTSGLMESADDAMDRLLLSTMEGHGTRAKRAAQPLTGEARS